MSTATNIIPFGEAKLPAHILARMGQTDLGDNSALGVAFESITKLSTEGKRFTVIEKGKETVINDPRTDEPANSIQVVIVRANPNNNRSYYTTGFQKGIKSRPACFSNDGVKPDAQSTDPQAKSCAVCPHNRFGSAIDQNGMPGKGKACTESKLLAVAAPDRLDRPMLLRVPPTSLKNLTFYGKLLAEKGVNFKLVATKIGFDPKVTHQQLTFAPVGFLPDHVVEGVFDIQDDETILRITGEARFGNEEEEAPAPVARVAPAPAPVVRKVRQDAPVAAPVEEVDEDEAEDDTPVTMTAREMLAKPAPVEKEKPVRKLRQDTAPAADEGLDDAIGSFLGGAFDDD